MARPKIVLRRKKGACTFCNDKIEPDWKNLDLLNRFISERGKVLSNLVSGTCAKHQRKLSLAIKRARYIGLVPFVTGV